MALTNNQHVLDWVKEMEGLMTPDKTIWIDGSEGQLRALREEAFKTGEMTELNQEKLPGCVLHHTAKNDVARVEGRTFICTKNKEDAGVINNWMDPEEMKAKLVPMYTLSLIHILRCPMERCRRFYRSCALLASWFCAFSCCPASGASTASGWPSRWRKFCRWRCPSGVWFGSGRCIITHKERPRSF